MKKVLIVFNLFIFLFSTTYLFSQARQVRVTKKDRRIALLIGNGAYKNSPLRNPANDATDMAYVLEKCGFKVTLLQNANKKAMEDSIREFGENIKNGEVGLFYYAGHGIQVRGINFLIPVDSEIQAEDEIEYKAVDAGFVLSKMDSANNEMNIIILDACRDNPFARSFRSSSKGLARMDAPQGSLIVYATSPGATAADGKGKNGIFTKNFLNEIKESNFEIMHLLRRVRKNVIDETDNKQIPWESSSMVGNFYFSYTDTQYEKVTSEISKLESQLEELEKQKMEAEKLKKEEEIREAARKTEDLKFRLKSQQLEQMRLAKEKARRAKIEEEAKRMEKEDSKRQEELARKKVAEEARLNELRRKLTDEQAKVKVVKQEVMTIAEGRKEVALLESKINNLKSLILSEQEKALNRLEEDYKPLIERMSMPIPPKDEFENTNSYDERVKRHQEKITALKNRYNSEYQEIENNYDNELTSRTSIFYTQITELENRKYPAEGLKVELLRYNADKKFYRIRITDFKGSTFKYSLSLDTEKAKGMKKRKNLLKVEGYYDGLYMTDSLSNVIMIDPILGRLSLVYTPGVRLRSSSTTLGEDEVNSMLRRKGFFDRVDNKSGEFSHEYELKTIGKDKVVIDHITDLMWHQSGSLKAMPYKNAKQWIIDLNHRGYAGYDDWRMPTLEEAASLLENTKKNGDLYIDPAFSTWQLWIWTCDKAKASYRPEWEVKFDDGRIQYRMPIMGTPQNCVRPVRSVR